MIKIIKRILNLPFVVVNWKTNSSELNLFGKFVFGIPVYSFGMLGCLCMLFFLILIDLSTLLFTKWWEHTSHRFGLCELWEDIRNSEASENIRLEDIRNLS